MEQSGIISTWSRSSEDANYSCHCSQSFTQRPPELLPPPPLDWLLLSPPGPLAARISVKLLFAFVIICGFPESFCFPSANKHSADRGSKLETTRNHETEHPEGKKKKQPQQCVRGRRSSHPALQRGREERRAHHGGWGGVGGGLSQRRVMRSGRGRCFCVTHHISLLLIRANRGGRK